MTVGGCPGRKSTAAMEGAKVFPLAPLAGSLLLVFKMRVDGMKLYRFLRRPLPQSAETIGDWLVVIRLVSWLSLVSNSALVKRGMGRFS